MPVPDILRCLSYGDFYGQYALGREHYRMLPGPILSIRCTDCSRCAVRRPNGVQVQQRLVRAQELFA